MSQRQHKQLKNTTKLSHQKLRQPEAWVDKMFSCIPIQPNSPR